MAADPVSRAGRVPCPAAARRSNRLIRPTPRRDLPAAPAPAPRRHRHRPHGHGTLPAAELHLNHNAARHLAVLAHAPLPHLTPALPRLAPNDYAHNTEAAARWTRLEAGQQPVRACTLCTRHQSHGATDTAWIHPTPHRLVCPRHHQAAPDPRLASPVHTWAVPQLPAAHHAHQRLLRHPGAATAWTAARAITTRWHDHQQHLTHRWHTRLNQLYAANPHLITTGSASPALLTRDLVTYPETVTLARALAALPNRQHRDTDNALALIARQLGLARLTPAVNDPLRAFLTHTRRWPAPMVQRGPAKA
ncbi:hypothetical protein [Streptomyces mirabilis]|uniref:hypothetical protein n=1 Tax=Streptomyces mirabilis TaxID=68239 RepID=UPI0033BA83AE